MDVVRARGCSSSCGLQNQRLFHGTAHYIDGSFGFQTIGLRDGGPGSHQHPAAASDQNDFIISDVDEAEIGPPPPVTDLHPRPNVEDEACVDQQRLTDAARC